MLYIGTPSSSEIRQVMSDGRLGCMTTPAQGNRVPPNAWWAADNGKFGKGWPGADAWFAWLAAKVADLGQEKCLFATAPDIVGDAAGTLVESEPWLPKMRELGIPSAFVAQDGCEQGLVPWGTFDLLFLGGTDTFKLGDGGAQVTAEAVGRGIPVHMGRVNSRKRLRLACELNMGCASADGTYLAFGPQKNLERLMRWMGEIERDVLDAGKVWIMPPFSYTQRHGVASLPQQRTSERRPPVSDSFVHLHNHTEYSTLDGAARLDDLIDGCVEMGMPALAITDHGTMAGAYELVKKAKAKGIKPIVGVEAYVAPAHRTLREKVLWGSGGEDDVSGGGAFTHMTMWAYNNQGMHNLFRLSTLASVEGMYYRPRMDRELLHAHHAGLIATTGCPSGEVSTRLRRGEYDLALKSAGELQDLFGFDNLYVELMDHGLEMERKVREDQIRLAKQLGAPLIVTNDLHYAAKGDARAHDALLCVQTGTKLADQGRFRFTGDDFYLKSPEEMRRLWKDLPSACDNTLAVAARCEVSFSEGVNLMPSFPVPDGMTEESYLRWQATLGLQKRYQGSQEHAARLEYELGVICEMGFPGYFLIVADFIEWAKAQGIRVGPGRGSGAGSIVAYVLGITELDPMAHGLMFERFLNPDRISMPDFDVDFDERRRDEVIGYVQQKYGADHVGYIITHGAIKARSAVKDATRVLGYEPNVGQVIVDSMPMVLMGKDVPLADIFDPEHERYRDGKTFRQYYGTDARMREIVDLAKGLEGLKRSTGVHAAGIIVADQPLIDLVPLHMRPADGAMIVNFDMGACESLGLLKFDFLGLRNLTIIEDCLAGIKYNKGEVVVPEDLPLDDVETFGLLARGETLGVFQLDGGAMRGLLQAMEPDCFNDISAVLALYRPGPMGVDSHTNYAERKTGRQQITPIHPELAEPLADILGETYGLIVYQEQIMSIAQKVAGYSLSQADLLRRAMGKKKKEILDKEYEPFAAGMAANGYSSAAVATLWDIMVPFADYAFNKSHSAAYGLVSYWTAYLKTHYPVEYMAALLTSVADKPELKPVYLAEAHRLGVPILPPSVNVSLASYTPDGKTIRFGLESLRGVGASVVGEIAATREASGSFASMADFLVSVPPVVRNKRTIESLIKSGAMDEFDLPRRVLMITSDMICEPGAEGLWLGDAVETFDVRSEEWSDKTLLAFEREMLGQTVSDRQPDKFRPVVVSLPATACTPSVLTKLGEILSAHPGPIPVHLHLVDSGRTSVMELDLSVSPNEALRYWLGALQKANILVKREAA